ncbi:MAG TPA: hypothetical protein VGJ05_13815 [Fimbriiglobus sp.]|jgi:hypothetical protein
MPRLLALPLLVALGSMTLAQQGGFDKVVYVDKKSGKERSEEGEVKESAGGVKVFVNGKEKLSLSPAEVVRVEYAEVPGIVGEDRGALLSLEHEKDAAKARAGFLLLRRKATGERSRKYLDFRELQAGTRVVDEMGTGDEFRREAARVADGWLTFAKDYPGTWEVWPAMRTRARLLADLGESGKAAEALDGLAKTTGLPADLRIAAALARCDVLLRAGAPAAQSAVNAVLANPSVPSAGPLRDRANVYRAWAAAPKPGDPQANSATAAAAIQTALDAAKDPVARAIGFNARGELFLAFGQLKQARWEFLWVETVYFQDKDELAKALRRLVQVFDKLGDGERAEQYREKLKKLRG